MLTAPSLAIVTCCDPLISTLPSAATLIVVAVWLSEILSELSADISATPLFASSSRKTSRCPSLETNPRRLTAPELPSTRPSPRLGVSMPL